MHFHPSATCRVVGLYTTYSLQPTDFTSADQAGTIQHEPADEHGAELHMCAATAMQCLSAFAEKVTAADDAAVARRIAPVAMRCILEAEPGFQFEARHGTHARE